MARTDTLEHFLTDVASAIKTKKGDQTAIQASSFDTEITNLPSGLNIDWTEIGYTSEPSTLQNTLTDAYNYTKGLEEAWDVNNPHTFYNDNNIIIAPIVDVTNLTGSSGNSMFKSCTNMLIAPDKFNAYTYKEFFYGCTSLIYVDVSNYSTQRLNLGVNGAIANMFYNCTRLKHIDFGNFETFDITRTNNIANMFGGCIALDSDTLNQILRLCILVTNNLDANYRKLSVIGITSSMINYNIIPNLSNYNDFIAAGWSLT